MTPAPRRRSPEPSGGGGGRALADAAAADAALCAPHAVVTGEFTFEAFPAWTNVGALRLRVAAARPGDGRVPAARVALRVSRPGAGAVRNAVAGAVGGFDVVPVPAAVTMGAPRPAGGLAWTPARANATQCVRYAPAPTRSCTGTGAALRGLPHGDVPLTLARVSRRVWRVEVAAAWKPLYRIQPFREWSQRWRFNSPRIAPPSLTRVSPRVDSTP